jgi:hypothetical protein
VGQGDGSDLLRRAISCQLVKQCIGVSPSYPHFRNCGHAYHPNRFTNGFYFHADYVVHLIVVEGTLIFLRETIACEPTRITGSFLSIFSNSGAVSITK